MLRHRPGRVATRPEQSRRLAGHSGLTDTRQRLGWPRRPRRRANSRRDRQRGPQSPSQLPLSSTAALESNGFAPRGYDGREWASMRAPWPCWNRHDVARVRPCQPSVFSSELALVYGLGTWWPLLSSHRSHDGAYLGTDTGNGLVWQALLLPLRSAHVHGVKEQARNRDAGRRRLSGRRLALVLRIRFVSLLNRVVRGLRKVFHHDPQ